MKKIFMLLVFITCVLATLLMWRGRQQDVISTKEIDLAPSPMNFSQKNATEAAPPVASGSDLSVANGDGSAEFLSLPLDRQAAILMGFNMAGHDSLLEYFNSLEDDVNSGKVSAAVVAARLYSRCRIMGQEKYSMDNPDHPSHPVAKACSAFPDRGQDYSSELIEKAAVAGIRDAVIAQFLFPPTNVIANPEHEESADWVNSAIARLDNLALRGDLEAIRQLALVYMQSEFGVKDNREAIKYLNMYIKLSPPNDPNRSVMQSSIDSLCGRVVFGTDANPCED